MTLPFLLDPSQYFAQLCDALLTCLQIVSDDGLPGQVCQECASQVDTCYKFKLQCESADTTLRALLKTEVTEVRHELLPAQFLSNC